MSERQVHVNQVRKIVKEIDALLLAGQFTKEVEKFQLKEAIFNLKIAEKHLVGFLQVDKYNGK